MLIVQELPPPCIVISQDLLHLSFTLVMIAEDLIGQAHYHSTSFRWTVKVIHTLPPVARTLHPVIGMENSFTGKNAVYK